MSEKINFDKFIDEATQYAHSELLKEGGKGLRKAIYLYVASALNLKDKGEL